MIEDKPFKSNVHTIIKEKEDKDTYNNQRRMTKDKGGLLVVAPVFFIVEVLDLDRVPRILRHLREWST